MKLGLIPARYSSSRLPGKALKDLHGLPMVVHVAKRSKLSESLDRVVVCTDHEGIAKACIEHSIEVCITPNSCLNGTERIFHACNRLNINDEDYIIDIQGDEPLVDPKSIDLVVEQTIKNSSNFDIVLPHLTPCAEKNKHIVKVISSGKKVMFLTRSDSPYPFNNESILKKHLSVIGFNYKSLKKFSSLPQGELEKIESIELLRALEGGMSIMTFPIDADSFSVDTIEDFERAERALLRCELFRKHYS